jgi:heterodisulfide reductase subunit C
MSHNEHHVVDNSLSGKILTNTEVKVQRCYQCGKCSAGCPVASDMDYPPSLILRMLQTGTPENEEKVLRSYSIWLCVTCEMCIGRCPMEVDIPIMMDYLRQESIRQNIVSPKAKDIVAFHQAFLDSIKNTGRLFEFGLIRDYKLKTFNLMQDITIAPSMYAKGKLHFIPEKIKNLSLLKRIFQKTK